MNKLHTFIATGAYSGYFPLVPGTIGSAAALTAWILIENVSSANFTVRFISLMLLLIVGIKASNSEIGKGEIKDPQQIVIDEWIGMWITLLVAPQFPTFFELFFAFALFRFFDMTKPWPVSWCERYPGAWGVILDDVAAGGISALLLMVFLYT